MNIKHNDLQDTTSPNEQLNEPIFITFISTNKDDKNKLQK